MNSSAEENGCEKTAALPVGHMAPEGYLVLVEGIYKDKGDGGVRMIASAPFYIVGRLINRERGETSYIIELISDIERETHIVKTTGGAKAIARVVEGAGVFLRGREVEEYINEYIARNWLHMSVTDKVEELEIDTEFESVYEQLVQFLLKNEERFEELEWGRFSDDFRTVFIRTTVMDEFLSNNGILNKRRTLNFWKGKGVLHADSDGRHLARSVRIDGKTQRAYVVSWPYDRAKDKDKSEVADGLKVGDKAKLVDIETGDVLKVHLLENPKTKDAGDSEISIKSPLGKALLGKASGDVVNVQVEGKMGSQYKVVNS